MIIRNIKQKIENQHKRKDIGNKHLIHYISAIQDKCLHDKYPQRLISINHEDMCHLRYKYEKYECTKCGVVSDKIKLQPLPENQKSDDKNFMLYLFIVVLVIGWFIVF